MLRAGWGVEILLLHSPLTCSQVSQRLGSGIENFKGEYQNLTMIFCRMRARIQTLGGKECTRTGYPIRKYINIDHLLAVTCS